MADPTADTVPNAKRKRSRSVSPPRQRKRPGAASRITAAEKEAQQQRQVDRERQQLETAQRAVKERGIQEGVTGWYNELQQRDRNWRATESKIKNLRSYNNWAKSTLIQRFSPNENFTAGASHGNPHDGLNVLDIGCGKGGDLQKWQKAPQRLQQYIGIDPAEVSIEQARGRYNDMRRKGNRLFRAEFITQDAYGQSLVSIPSVREIGFDPGAGPEANSRWGGGGFDVVSMMFCMHYAFESADKVKGMLANVAGALKKGGRFIGVIPNSDVIRAKILDFYKHPSRAKQVSDTTKDGANKSADSERKGKCEGGGPEAPKDSIEEVFPEWGNSLYRIRFPNKVPEDGIFRPPYGWKYNYFLEEAVEEVPEYVVPWEAFRAIAEDYNLEMQYRKPLPEIWNEEKHDHVLGNLSVRMKVTDRVGGRLLLSEAELEAVGLYHAFCFYKV